MSWAKNDYTSDLSFDYNDANAIGNSIRSWEGNVDANGHNLVEVGTMTGNYVIVGGDSGITPDASSAPLQVGRAGSASTAVSASFNVGANRRLWVGLTSSELTLQSLNAAQSANQPMVFVASQYTFSGGLLAIDAAAWNGSHFQMGSYHFWVDSSGRLRIKSSAPSSDTDGTVVGTQS